ncbi:hypothetical protein CLF_111663 [Clonorchis sinensis]|uniref:Uncharacterized protein n=1 Tax=Clonorchis sinensis TaxID=79923 RepID=G7YV70_CLOSI|nr:hypothetical protein CLF_111663 [Clonorchis sinensis]
MIGANSLLVELDPGRLVQLQRQDPVSRKVAAASLDVRSVENGEEDKELETFQSHFDRLRLNESDIISWNATDSDVVLPVIARFLRRNLCARIVVNKNLPCVFVQADYTVEYMRLFTVVCDQQYIDVICACFELRQCLVWRTWLAVTHSTWPVSFNHRIPKRTKRTLQFHIGFAPPCFLGQSEMNPAAQRTAHPSPLTLKCDVRYGAVQKLKHVRPMMARHCHTQFDSTPATIPFLLSTVPSPTRSINCEYDELLNRPQLTP